MTGYTGYKSSMNAYTATCMYVCVCVCVYTDTYARSFSSKLMTRTPDDNHHHHYHHCVNGLDVVN